MCTRSSRRLSLAVLHAGCGFVASLVATTAASAADTGPTCEITGPQMPRDVSNKAGARRASWPLALASTSMNLCNIHFHVNAEHKGPGFFG
jgi:hypothetical protein